MAKVNTGLGWEADSAYLVYASGTDLGSTATRTFTKVNDGYAIGLFRLGVPGTASKGPILFSTDPDAVKINVDGLVQSATWDFQYLRRTWYLTAPMHESYDSEYTTGVLIPDANPNLYYWSADRVGCYIGNKAQARSHVSWRGVSFAAGFAVGLATRAWAYMGEVVMGLITKLITRNGTYNAAADGADGYSSVVVNVPNSYTAADEGKAVENGELVSQTSRSITQTGTYDTTYNNQVVVSVNVTPASGEVF